MKQNKFDLFQIVHEEFQIGYEMISERTEFRNLDNWNSLGALIFISAITEKTGIFISSTDLAQWKTLGDIQGFIDSKTP